MLKRGDMLRGIFMEKVLLPMFSKRSVESYLERRWKRLLKTATKKAVQKAATKTGEYAGEKAGDKIIQLLSKKNKNTKTPAALPIENPQSRELSDYEINDRVNQLLSGGQMRRFI